MDSQKVDRYKLATKNCPYCRSNLGLVRRIIRINRRRWAHYVCFEEEDMRDEAMMFEVKLLYPSNAIDIAIERELEKEEEDLQKKAKVIPLRQAV